MSTSHQTRWIPRSLKTFWALMIVATVIGLFNPTVQAEEPGFTVLVNRVDDQSFPLVTARITVIDESGLAINRLKPADFLVLEDDQVISDFSVAPVDPAQADPISLILAVDVSGSMDEIDEQGIRKIEAAQAAAKEFLLPNLGPNDQAGLIAFSETISMAQPVTSDRTILTAAIDALALEGDTALYDALFQAVDEADGLPPGKKAVILLTDGLNTHGSLELGDALNRAREVNVPVYTVGFFTGNLDPASREQAEADLTRIATVTHGQYFAAPTGQELNQLFRELALALRQSQYDLSFESVLTADCEAHQMRVRVKYQEQSSEDFAEFDACPNAPVEIALDGPAEGQQIHKKVLFTPRVASPWAIAAVEYLINDTPVAKYSEPPFEFEWDTTTEPPGSYTMSALFTDSAGQPHTIERRLIVQTPLSVQIVSPEHSREITYTAEARVETAGPGQVNELALYWNDEVVATVSEKNFLTYTIDAQQHLEGEYVLLARAHEVDGYEVEDSITVKIKAVPVNPGIWIALGSGIFVLALVIPLALLLRRRNKPGTTASVSAWLVMQRGPQPGQRFALVNPVITLGRDRLANDIHTPGRQSSRHHALIKVSNGQYQYQDLKATNPTRINGQDITGSHLLVEGDRLEIGDVILNFTRKEN